MTVSLTAHLTRLWQQKHVRRVLQVIWVGLITFFIGFAIFSNREAITSIEWTSERLSLIGLAIISTLVRRLTGGLRWVWIIRLLSPEQKISMRQGLKIYFVSNLATYIPGTYWYILGRASMSQKHGVSALETGVSILIEHYLMILSGALLSIFGLQLIAELLGLSVSSFLWIALIALIGLAAIHPWSIRQVTNLMARALKLQPIESSLSYGMMLVQLLWSILNWVFGSMSLLLVARAFVPTIGLDQLGLFSAVFSTSWLIGFFTPFAPSGLGVREGVMVGAFTAMGMPPAITAILAVLSRLLIIFEDLFWAAFSLLL